MPTIDRSPPRIGASPSEAHVTPSGTAETRGTSAAGASTRAGEPLYLVTLAGAPLRVTAICSEARPLPAGVGTVARMGRNAAEVVAAMWGGTVEVAA